MALDIHNFIARNFRGPDLAGVDYDRSRNALMQNQVNRLPQQNRAEDLALQQGQQQLRMGEQDLRAGEQQLSEGQMRNAAGILGRQIAMINSAQSPLAAAQQITMSPDFQAAAAALKLPPMQIVPGQDTDDSVRAETAALLQALGGALPERYAQEQGPGGAVMQRNLGTNQVNTLLGREPQQPTPSNGPTPPSGYRYKVDGTLEATPGGPADPFRPQGPPGPKSMTEGDKRNSLMFDSMVNAEQQIADMVAAGNTADTSSKMDALLGLSGLTVAQSDDFKQYESAGLRWAANLLYMKSGATATPDEIRSTWRQFFPQPGEGAQVKEQKRAARLQEMRSAGMIVGREVPNFGETAAASAPSGMPNLSQMTDEQLLEIINGQ